MGWAVETVGEGKNPQEKRFEKRLSHKDERVKELLKRFDGKLKRSDRRLP
jgi:hypothetical protein